MGDLDDIFKAWEEGDVDKFMSYYTNSGWICPKCDKVYSPHVKECSHCNKTNNDKSYPLPPDPECRRTIPGV